MMESPFVFLWEFKINRVKAAVDDRFFPKFREIIFVI